MKSFYIELVAWNLTGMQINNLILLPLSTLSSAEVLSGLIFSVTDRGNSIEELLATSLQGRRKRYGPYGHGLTKISYILFNISQILFKNNEHYCLKNNEHCCLN